MPELPDITIYLERLGALISGQPLNDMRIVSPFVLRSVDPAKEQLIGRVVQGVRRMGKRIVFQLEEDYFCVLHLMIAGRLRWRKSGTALPKRNGLVAFDFPNGSVLFTEASKKRRASLHLVLGSENLGEFDRAGLEVLDANEREFCAALQRDNHTLKRALTDPRILSGVGNAYSDEILHRARLSPFKQTQKMTAEELARLFVATQSTLSEWITRLRDEVGEGFPEKVTAFREGMAVHGRYREPCPDCGSPVQRIVYAQNECNYCARCQTDGKMLADRALSRLLKADWPKTLEDLEEGRG